MANLGSNDTAVAGDEFSLPAGAQLDEESGDLVIRDSGGNVVFRRDEAAGEWVSDSLNVDNATIKDRLGKFHIRKSDGGTFYANAQQNNLASESFASLDGALQHALDEIDNDGGRIEVSDTCYGSEITNTVDLSGKADSLTIEFSGYQATPNKIILADNVDGPMFLWDGATAGERDYGFSLLGLTAEGNKANNSTDSHGFQTRNEDQTTSGQGLRDVFLDRVFFDRFAGDGIRIRDCWGWRLTGSVFLERNDGNGLYVEGTGSNLKAVGSKIRHNNNFDIRIGRPQCSFIGCELGGPTAGNQADHAVVTAANADGLGLIECQLNETVNEPADLNSPDAKLIGGRVNGTIDGAGTTDLRVSDADFNGISRGTRTTVNGEGLNNGDPSTSGDWNGNGQEGITVYDTSVARPYTQYQYVDGAWQSV